MKSYENYMGVSDHTIIDSGVSMATKNNSYSARKVCRNDRLKLSQCSCEFLKKVRILSIFCNIMILSDLCSLWCFQLPAFS